MFPIGSRGRGTIGSICVDLTVKQGRLPELDSYLLPEDVLVSHVVDGGLLFFLAKKGPPGTSGSLAMKVSSLALIVAASPVGNLIEIDRIVLMQPASRWKVSGCMGDLAKLVRSVCFGSTPIATSLYALKFVSISLLLAAVVPLSVDVAVFSGVRFLFSVGLAVMSTVAAAILIWQLQNLGPKRSS